MNKTSKPILFFGTEDFSARFLTALIDAGYDIRAVITKPDTPRGRGHQLASPLVKTIAQQHLIEVWQPERLVELTDKLASMGDIAGVLVSYGKIIPGSILELFNPGIINVHPSLLPRYRGPSPIESAIANRDAETGVSIMKLVRAMDAGPVYTQTRIELDHTETKRSLYQTLADAGVAELLRTLPSILDGSLLPHNQDDAAASYCELLSKENGVLNPLTSSASSLEAKVRAYQDFPKTRLNIFGHDSIVTKSHVAENSETPLSVRCSDGMYLVIDELIAPSGRTMQAGDFLRGYAA